MRVCVLSVGLIVQKCFWIEGGEPDRSDSGADQKVEE